MLLDFDIKVKCKKGLAAPDAAFVFVDPYWSGVWCHDYDKSTKSFRVSTTLRKLDVSALGRAEGHPSVMGDTMKIFAYYRQPTRYEFICSGVVPMHKLASLKPMAEERINTWRAAEESCDSKQLSMGGISFSLKINKTISYPPNESVIPVSLPTPNRGYHTDVKRVAEWLDKTFQKMYPANTSGFTMMRSNCEAPFMTTLFSDLPAFFSANNYTTLPPTIAVYLMVNALHQHGLTPNAFTALCCECRPSPNRTRLLLNVVRDVLCAWTMCRYEGRYEPDTYLGKASDHQPFKNSCKPGTRVFDADDCEVKCGFVLWYCFMLLL